MQHDKIDIQETYKFSFVKLIQIIFKVKTSIMVRKGKFFSKKTMENKK